jgi:large subunit ribosomal protein L17
MPKAKEVKSFAEKMITLAKKGTLAARRRAIQMLGDRDIIEYEDDKPVKKGTVIGKLFSEIGPRYLDRDGGYTRIVRLSLRRLGDNGQLVLLQLLGENEKVEPKQKKSQVQEVDAVEAEEQDVVQKEQVSEEQATEATDESVEQTGSVDESEDTEKSNDESPDETGGDEDQNKQ